MLKKILCCILIFAAFQLHSQITGTVKDQQGKTLPYVNIYTENGNAGTTTNDEGYYELKISKPGNYKLVYQFLGFKTQRKSIQYNGESQEIDVMLEAESTSLDEVTINSGENPANAIMRKAIANRKKNAAKLESFTADFYSRGLWRIKNAPEKILGQEVGDLGGRP